MSFLIFLQCQAIIEFSAKFERLGWSKHKICAFKRRVHFIERYLHVEGTQSRAVENWFLHITDGIESNSFYGINAIKPVIVVATANTSNNATTMEMFRE